jgi:hypothetical protein
VRSVGRRPFRPMARQSNDGARASSDSDRRTLHRWCKPAAFAVALVVLVAGSSVLALKLWGKPTTVYVLTSGSVLEPGQEVLSPNGSHYLIMQTDGNLVTYNSLTGKPTWSTGLPGDHNAYAKLESAGLNVYQVPTSHSGKSPAVVWSSGAPGPGAGPRLEVTNNGCPVIRSDRAPVYFNPDCRS